MLARVWLILVFLTLANAQNFNITFRLSTYQTSASDVTLWFRFFLAVDIPAGGYLVISTSPGGFTTGTTSNPPGGGTRTPATIICGDAGGPYTPIPSCDTLVFPNPLYDNIGPYRIQFPNGLASGSEYGLALGMLRSNGSCLARNSQQETCCLLKCALNIFFCHSPSLGGLYNQPNEGTSFATFAWTTDTSGNTYLETNFASTQYAQCCVTLQLTGKRGFFPGLMIRRASCPPITFPNLVAHNKAENKDEFMSHECQQSIVALVFVLFIFVLTQKAIPTFSQQIYVRKFLRRVQIGHLHWWGHTSRDDSVLLCRPRGSWRGMPCSCEVEGARPHCLGFGFDFVAHYFALLCVRIRSSL